MYDYQQFPCISYTEVIETVPHGHSYCDILSLDIVEAKTVQAEWGHVARIPSKHLFSEC